MAYDLLSGSGALSNICDTFDLSLSSEMGTCEVTRTLGWTKIKLEAFCDL